MSALAALGPGEGAELELRTALTWASIDTDQYALLLSGLDGLNVSATLDAARVAEQNRLIFDQVIGTLDAIAINGRDGEPGLCPELSFGIVLPTLPPTPTAPPAGPSPPGTVAEQAAAALAAFGLRAAAGIEFTAPGEATWRPAGTFDVRGMKLANSTGATVQYPFELSAALWNGKAWETVPCAVEPDVETNVGPLCAVRNGNTSALPAGATASDETDSPLAFGWPGVTGADPGTYALVVPIWRTNDEYPTTTPSEAAVAIVSVIPGS
jgi:hypothetical protein